MSSIYDPSTYLQESEDFQLSVGRSVPWSLEDAYVAFMNHEKRPLRLDRFKGMSSFVCVCASACTFGGKLGVKMSRRKNIPELGNFPFSLF